MRLKLLQVLGRRFTSIIGHRCERTVAKRDKSRTGGTLPHASLVAKLQKMGI